MLHKITITIKLKYHLIPILQQQTLTEELTTLNQRHETEVLYWKTRMEQSMLCKTEYHL